MSSLNSDSIEHLSQFQKSKSSNGSGNSTSSEPYPLFRELPPPEKYPMDTLGSLLGGTAKKLREVIKAPDGICGQSVLAAAALAVQSRRDFEIDGRQYPLSENFMSIAESGDRKSAIDNEVLKPHRDFEKKLHDIYQKENEEYEIELSAYRSAKEAALKKAKTKEEKKKALEELGKQPLAPLDAIITAEEPTYEGIIKLLASGQPSIGLFADEGGRMFGGHAMTAEQRLKTITGLSELWDGKRSSRVRSGDGAMLLYGKRLSMHMMIQPIVAQPILSDALFLQQGFWARFLTTWPESTAGSRPYESVDLSKDHVLIEYRCRISEILDLPLPLAEGKRNELKPRPLSLSDKAKSLWIKFHDKIECQLPDGKPLASIRAFANKAPQHAQRLAGILAAAESVDTESVSLDWMGAGIELVQFYIGESLRLYNSSFLNPDLLLAQKLLVWAQQFEHVHLQKIYQYGPSTIREAATAKRIVKILEDHGWLTHVKNIELDGSKRKDAWKVYR